MVHFDSMTLDCWLNFPVEKFIICISINVHWACSACHLFCCFNSKNVSSILHNCELQVSFSLLFVAIDYFFIRTCASLNGDDCLNKSIVRKLVTHLSRDINLILFNSPCLTMYFSLFFHLPFYLMFTLYKAQEPFKVECYWVSFLHDCKGANYRLYKDI